MEFSSAQRAALADILAWRRDVRRFREDGIDPAILAEIEAAVDLAPSVGNSRPWRLVRVKRAARRRAILADFDARRAAAGEIYDPATRARYDGLKLAGLAEAPVHLAVFTDTAPVAGAGLGRQSMPETLTYSTVMAIHTLWLVARARNIGVGWVSILDSDTVTSILEVPDSWRFTAYLCLGHPLEFDDRPELERAGWQENTASVWLDR